MRGSEFHRLRKRVGRAGGGLGVWVAGIGSALLVPVLIVLTGLVAWLFITPDPTRGVGWLLPPESGNWPPGGSRLNALWIFTGTALVIFLLEAALLYWLELAARAASVDAAVRLKAHLFAQALELGSADLLGRGVTPTEELFEEPVEVFREACAVWWRAIPRSVMLLGLLVLLALWVSIWIALVAAILGLGLTFLFRRLTAQAELQTRYWRTEVDSRRLGVLAKVRQLPLVAGYALREAVGEPFGQRLEHYRQAALKLHTRNALIVPLMLFAALTAGLLLLVIAGVNVLKAQPELSAADVVLLVGCMLCAYPPAMRLLRLHGQLEQADETAAALTAYLDRRPGITEVPAATPVTLAQDIRLDSVTLADRSGAKLLDGVSLRIPAGGRVALLSTDSRVPLAVAGLLVRFYDPTAGRLLFDGKDLRQVGLETLRRQVVLVTQQGLVFSGTAGENVTCGDSRFTLAHVTEALRNVGVFDDVQGLPHGLETEIGDGGTRLNVRQALGIALARAILRQPSLMVLEEPPADDAPEHGEMIDAALARASEGRTLIVLPQRLSTLRAVDRIVVFHQGKVHAEGAHEDLTAASDLYRHLIYLRFNPYREHMT